MLCLGLTMCMDHIYFYGLLCLSFMLHGMINDTLGQMCSCIDSGNCDFTNQCVPEGACIKENVAIGKVANISSQNTISGPACLAVNGNTTMKISSNNCVKSDDKEEYPSWTVDLGQDYTITNVSIYPEHSHTTALRGLEITVDGRLCYTFSSLPYYYTRQDVQCTQPQRGRIVRLYSSGNFYIFFCELQIWVCIDGYYGNDCGFRCGNCLGGVCDKINGTCPNGCEAGWQNTYCKQECDDDYYGLSCNHTCGKCANFNICNKTSGVCPGGCDNGWKTPYCNKTCDNGTYGQNCSGLCGNCTNSEPCDKVSGTCLTCEPGLKPSLCQEACDNGTYGQHCSHTCGNCTITEPCNKVSGTCLTCEPGLKPSLCQEACDNGNYGQNCSGICGNCTNSEPCNKVSGTCLTCEPGLKPSLCQQVCDNGTYGHQCSSLCGNCTNGEPCDKVNGSCISCVPGLKPPLCQQELLLPSEKHNSAGAIAGGVVGGLLAALGVAVAILLVRRRQCQRAKSSDQPNTNGGEINSMEPISIEEPSKHSDRNGSASNVSSSMKPFCVVSPSTGSGGQEYVNVNALPFRRPEMLPKTNNDIEQTSSIDNIDDDNDVIYNNENIYSTYQTTNTMTQLDDLQRSLLQSLKSDQETRNQFQSLPKGMRHPYKSGSLQENLRKNRFKSLFPYDHSRVKLQRTEHDTESDYINASYIRGFEKAKAYIAAQGPREHTVDDMWLMIWQENIAQIVMLTNLKENGKEKCTEYWPSIGTTCVYGHVTVSSLSEEMRADFIIRTFSLRLKGRQVDQYHYVSWSDHDIPSASSLVNFWRYVKARGLSLAPLLVHCSAGVGRTGTYMALDVAMEMATHQREVDVFKIVTDLREDRAIMVQTESQYRFLYEVLLEAYTSRNTRLRMEQFDVMFTGDINVHESNKFIDKEFKMLQQMGQYSPKPKYEMAGAQENRKKNRHPEILPDDTYLAYLSGYLKGRNMYINAVFLSELQENFSTALDALGLLSFKQYRGILLTQLPLPDTLVDIWRLVEDKDVNTIVSIGSKEEQKTVKAFCQYWPRSAGDTLTTGPYTITLTSSVVLNVHLTSYHLSVKIYAAIVSTEFQKESRNRDIRLLHYTDWAGEVPEDTSELIQLVENLNASRSSGDPSPVLVQCIDGAARSGLFSVLWDVISRASCDQEIDVYLTARRVQTVRRQAVTTEVQYRYCYKVAQDYHRQRGVYQNTE